jgi:tetratricopeptide (TPR) repeat protein
VADHNDPNAVNSIFSDIDYSAADLYDLFGYPTNEGRTVLLALTFASTPQAGVLDSDMLYRLLVTSHPRVAFPQHDQVSLDTVLGYFDAVKDKYLGELKAAEIRVTVTPEQRATVKFIGFPCGDFTTVLDLNRVVPIQTPDGQTLQAFIGGRDDAFFNDLTGFFRSINYAPQFYHVPHTMTEARELPIPKTLLELEGNDLFNFRPDFPTWGVMQKDGTTPKLVKQTLAMSPRLAQRPCGRAILADIDFQEGRYQESANTLQTLLEENRTWDVLARLAHWNGKMGEPDEADQLYAEAADELTAKEMRSLAWLELQRGALALSQGHLDSARRHYECASSAFPGHWRTDEHRAALLAAEGNLAAAETLLREVLSRSPKPELKQALGELLAARGKQEEAVPWLQAAACAFLTSVEEGGVHYYHHLADLCADALNQPAEAVHWARQDLHLRHNFTTQTALAWALYKNNELSEATHWIRLALCSGARGSSLFATASEIFHASGNHSESERYRHAAEAINPIKQTLHLHH